VTDREPNWMSMEPRVKAVRKETMKQQTNLVGLNVSVVLV
jgi:hypothetical protein